MLIRRNLKTVIRRLPDTRFKLLMVRIVDGNSEINAHVGNNFCYLICLRHLIRSNSFTNRAFFSKKTIFLHPCATCSELSSNISSMVSMVIIRDKQRFIKVQNSLQNTVTLNPLIQEDNIISNFYIYKKNLYKTIFLDFLRHLLPRVECDDSSEHVAHM